MIHHKVLFCRSESVISKMITWFTGEPVSHAALAICLCDVELVFHSNLLGVSITTMSHFKKKYAILAETAPINLPITFEDISKKESSWYDIMALLWLGSRFALKKFFRIPIPKANLWQVTGMFTCTELVTQIINNEENSLITPFGLLLELRKKGITIKTDLQLDPHE